MVVTEVRKYMEAAAEKLTPARAQELARSLLQAQGQQRKEQVQKVAQDLMDWSNHTRERMTDLVRREVARQLKTMGVASKADVDALKARVRDLERRAGRRTTSASSATARSRAVASRRGAKRTSATRAKGTTSKATTAVPAKGAERTPAKRSGRASAKPAGRTAKGGS